jgi:hypothetical protein
MAAVSGFGSPPSSPAGGADQSERFIWPSETRHASACEWPRRYSSAQAEEGGTGLRGRSPYGPWRTRFPDGRLSERHLAERFSRGTRHRHSSSPPPEIQSPAVLAVRPRRGQGREAPDPRRGLTAARRTSRSPVVGRVRGRPSPRTKVAAGARSSPTPRPTPPCRPRSNSSPAALLRRRPARRIRPTYCGASFAP